MLTLRFGAAHGLLGLKRSDWMEAKSGSRRTKELQATKGSSARSAAEQRTLDLRILGL